MFGASAEPARVGRFVVLETLGAGGMGVVHAAYDPRLDRKIALKLVKPEVAAAGTNGEARLLREAQAMARLSHPNVVQIHEVGAWEGRVFIAMELVAGRSLATWLEVQPRGWREVVHMFAEAGRGLAAAHAAGMVHRDFKPENVLVGDDGRVRVTDFGLARGGVSESEAGETWREPGDPLAAIVEGMSVGTAAFAGTPRFMSPEQFLGEPATAASDQFSFCVALYVALHGVHPFVGEDRATLARAVIAGERREPPRMRVPRKIHKAVVKGLARAPEGRFAGMGELLRAIEPRAGWQRVMPVALFAVTGAGAAGMMYEGDPCEDTGALLAGTWDDEQKEMVEQAFATSQMPGADILWSTTSNELSLYVGAVAESYRQSCRAHQRRASEPRIHALRVDCLHRRLGVVRSVIGELTTGGPGALRQAPVASARFGELSGCEDERALLLGMDPAPLGSRVAVEWAWSKVGQARSSELFGELERSRAQARVALAEAREVGYDPVIAEALYQLGRLDLLESQYNAAEIELREALNLAVKSRHDALVSEIWSWLVQAIVLGSGETREAEHWLRQAHAWLGRSAHTSLLRAELERAQGAVYQAKGDFVNAEAATRNALELRESVTGADNLQVTIDRLNYIHQVDSLGQTDQAIEIYRRVLIDIKGKVGAVHNLTADVYYNLAVALLRSSAADALVEAEDSLENAYSIVVALHGNDALDLALYNIAWAQLAQLREDPVAADRHLADAERIFEHYPGHPDRAILLGFRGVRYLADGRLDEALAAHVEARSIGVAVSGEGSEVVRMADSNIGDVLKAKGDLGGALRQYVAAIAAIEQVLGRESQELINPLVGMGEAEVASGRYCEAVTVFDRALKLMSAQGIESMEIGEVAASLREASSRC
jgi:tetratricopeptide (TPR) repeat protein